jgi:hypothetical protein
VQKYKTIGYFPIKGNKIIFYMGEGGKRNRRVGIFFCEIKPRMKKIGIFGG